MFAWGFSKPNQPKTVKKLLKTLQNSPKIKNDQQKILILNSIYKSFKRKHKLFSNHLRSLNLNFDLEHTVSFQSQFSLRPDQIVVAAD